MLNAIFKRIQGMVGFKTFFPSNNMANLSDLFICFRLRHVDRKFENFHYRKSGHSGNVSDDFQQFIRFSPSCFPPFAVEIKIVEERKGI